MQRKDRKEIFLLVSEGGFIEDIQRAWKDVKDSSLGKMVGKKIERLLFGPPRTEMLPKAKEDKVKNNKPQKKENREEKGNREEKRAPLKSVKYSSPLKDNWKNYGSLESKSHHPKGMAMGAAKGTNIYPAAPGKVFSISNSGKGGNSISIEHMDGNITCYSHLDGINVRPDQPVDQNTVIGYLGDSGDTVGKKPYLYFSFKDTGPRGSWKDPSLLFYVSDVSNEIDAS